MRRRGFTLLEVLIASSILIAVCLGMARLFKIPFTLQGWVNDADIQRTANTALDRWVKDVKESIPNSIRWDAPPSPWTLAFAKPRFDPGNGQFLTPSSVVYQFVPGEGNSGTLFRIEDGTRTVTLDHVRTPQEDVPLFTRDGSLHVVMLSLRVEPHGRPALRFVRRVALAH